MHPLVEAFVRRMETEAVRKGSYRSKMGKNEIEFLEQVWGPEFEGLSMEYPLKDYKGGDRFADFIYVRGSLKLLIEMDDFTTHAKEISPGDFSDHLYRQNDFVLAGWTILRFTPYQVRKFPVVCRRQLKQAIGTWWVNTQAGNRFNRANMYRSRLVQLAIQEGRPIRAAEAARELQVSRNAARRWLQIFAEEGGFIPVRANQRVTGYLLREGHDNKPNLSGGKKSGFWLGLIDFRSVKKPAVVQHPNLPPVLFPVGMHHLFQKPLRQRVPAPFTWFAIHYTWASGEVCRSESFSSSYHCSSWACRARISVNSEIRGYWVSWMEAKDCSNRLIYSKPLIISYASSRISSESHSATARGSAGTFSAVNFPTSLCSRWCRAVS